MFGCLKSLITRQISQSYVLVVQNRCETRQKTGFQEVSKGGNHYLN